jgi:hypothetical protein
VTRLGDLISRQRERGTEVLRFPPVMSRWQLERSGYLKSSPHFLGCVCCLSDIGKPVSSPVRNTPGSRQELDLSR